MTLFDLKEHLRSLVEAHAPSGHEAPIRAIIREAWSGMVDEFEQDKLGSLIGIKRATTSASTGTSAQPARRIMLAAHMDEIGMMVSDVVDGFIFVQRVAGMDNRVMMAQPVLVHGRETLKGVVATVPPHLLNADARKKYPPFEAMVVDVGLPAERVAELVRIGDLITPDTPMLEMAGDHLVAKAFDDRACVAAVSAALNHLQGISHNWDVYATATIQEESGLLGAATAAHLIQPDIAIALDVTFGEQSGIPQDDASEVGGGVSIALGANFHPRLFDKLVEVAKEYEIKHQLDVIPARSGTDAWAIQVAREGVPTALLSIPIRNMHSPVETLQLKDVARAGRLLAQFIASLDDDFMGEMTWDKAEEASK
jgi:putative aminopeptidase FrvX